MFLYRSAFIDISLFSRYAACVGPDQSHCNGGSQVRTVRYAGSEVTKEQAENTLKIQLAFLIILSIFLIIVSIALYLQVKRLKRANMHGKLGETGVPLKSSA